MRRELEEAAREGTGTLRSNSPIPGAGFNKGSAGDVNVVPRGSGGGSDGGEGGGVRVSAGGYYSESLPNSVYMKIVSNFQKCYLRLLF